MTATLSLPKHRRSAMMRRAAFTFVTLIAHALACPPAVLAAEAPPWSGEHDDAVLLARLGRTGPALAVLDRLHRQHPEDAGVTRDLIAIDGWAGRDGAAIGLFTTLPQAPQADYLIEAVALAYRHLDQPAQALILYRHGLAESPDNSRFAAGEIRALVDLGRFAPAILVADADLRARGERVDVLLAAGAAASAQKAPVEALRYIDRALKRAPANREAMHDRLLAIDEMGAPQVARQLADDHPGALNTAELRRVDGDAAAALVRWGALDPVSEEQRFAASDRAIGVLDGLIAAWSRLGDGARGDVLRARFDRMVAYRDRVRMTEVLAEYDDLSRHGANIPGYALAAAADAALYVRQPETARDLYRRALQSDPSNAEIRLALFYAYVELEDFDAAYAQADFATADQVVWLYLKGLEEPLENPDRATAELAAADARLYGDELAEAHRRLAAMAEAAPNNTRYVTALANLYSARGWQRRAAEEYEISRALKPRDVATEVDQARNSLDLRDYRQAEGELADLKRRFPENLDVRRLDRLWQVHDMAEFRLNVEQTLRSSNNAQDGTGIAIDARLYSAPIDYNWRIFASEYIGHEQLLEGEGTITLRRSAAGAEYRGRDLVASVEGTVNAYGRGIEDTLTGAVDGGRGGARAQVAWSINDFWRIDGGAELFARDTPLRALGSGVTANAASTGLTYRASESRKVELGGEVMDFSDGNLRTSLTGTYTERLLTRPRFSLDAVFGGAESGNSADSRRAYYNPRQDAEASAGLSLNQTLYRRYEFVYDHHLAVTPGAYWEQGYGGGGVASILYEHRVEIDDAFEAGLGLSVSRQPYDGAYENTTAMLLNLRWRL